MDIICDLDGTLADCEHRRHWIRTNPKNYEAFHLAEDRDTLIAPVAIVIQSLARFRHQIILCSARPESSREVTEKWLAKHQIKYAALYMRENNDSRSGDIIKEELLDRIFADGFSPMLVFEDRTCVVAMWRRRGLICAQVADGDF